MQDKQRSVVLIDMLLILTEGVADVFGSLRASTRHPYYKQLRKEPRTRVCLLDGDIEGVTGDNAMNRGAVGQESVASVRMRYG